jgi:hypothetical protein
MANSTLKLGTYDGEILFSTSGTAGTSFSPATGYGSLYYGSDRQLRLKDDQGAITVLGSSGFSGSSGSSGTSGNNGAVGSSGSSGSSGTSGTGSPGTSGTSGNGSPGTSGTSGNDGAAGSSGSSGSSGNSGSSGTSGQSLGLNSKNLYYDYLGWTGIYVDTDFGYTRYKDITFSTSFGSSSYSIDINWNGVYISDNNDPVVLVANSGQPAYGQDSNTGLTVRITNKTASGFRLSFCDMVSTVPHPGSWNFGTTFECYVTCISTGEFGSPGTSGTSGETFGTSGTSGNNGLAGSSGSSGSSGTSGNQGPIGPTGPTGPGVTITNNAATRLIIGTATATEVNGESTLTYINTGSNLGQLSVNGLLVWPGKSGVTSNVAIGPNTLAASNSTGGSNTAVGDNAMYSNTTGANNVSVGAYSLYVNTRGNYNVAVGANALGNVTTGSNNIGIGESSLYSIDTETNNIAIGYNSGYNVSSGSNNIILGATGGTAGMASTFVYYADANNNLTINSGAVVTASNTSDRYIPIVIGGTTYKLLLST